MPRYVASPMTHQGNEIHGEYENVSRMIAFGLKSAVPGRYRIMSVEGKKRRPITVTYVSK